MSKRQRREVELWRWRFMVERDLRYQQRFEQQNQSLEIARHAAEKALAKAETAYDKRFEGQNEFREQMGDQQRTYITKAEVMYLAGFIVSTAVAVFAILGYFRS